MKKRSEAVRPGWPEWCVLGLFAVLLTLVSVFHEPWFDEAEAWQIAKCASLKDILFTIPHYEGHPPLWHLVLLIPVRLGVPFEVGLKTVGILFSTVAAALLIFRSPFPRFVRLLLPFSYFLFYQYGVIVRPYCMMMAAFYLLAMVFSAKDARPWRFMLALLFLCLCSAYGVVFAGGIAVVWLWDIVTAHRAEGTLSLKALLKDRRIQALCVLLLAALALIAGFLPKEDTHATNIQSVNTFPERLLVTLFTFIPESLCTQSNWYSGVNLLSTMNIRLIYLIPAGALGILVCIFLWAFSPQGKYRWFVLPYLLFAVFAAAVYINAHHVGITLLFLLFWLWTIWDDPKRGENFSRLCSRLSVPVPDVRSRLFRFRKPALLLCCLLPLISLFWTVASSVLDIENAYMPSREAAQFLKETGLDKRTIMGCWAYAEPEDDDPDTEEDETVEEYLDTNSIAGATEICGYFDCNIFFNFNNGNDRMAYFNHITLSDEENLALLASWADTVPEVLIGMPELEQVYHGSVTADDFTPVLEIVSGTIWKGSQQRIPNYIYVRNDLVDEYGLTAVEIRPYFTIE